ncbi:CarD family transcriptional regulator [Tissierella sp.]|uniref:CarD family transcriptional regulator n=1 Tax=Tissierella sp. TaxID=41274 RepID=UPI00285D415C|nr:CarD family transcriptional regulator [Tissierella sp.]MDR7856524.1 CarD family transcriptional regulator [Tissierella sp.]
MFDIGDLIIYSGQGICCIDEICEREYFGVTKSYYVLHPVENDKLKISIPVDSQDVVMLRLMDREEAEEIIETFKLAGIEWIDKVNHRNQVYSNIVKTGNRKEISMIVNTLMREKIKTENNGKKFDERDKKLLISVQNILFSELALPLNTTVEAIEERILGIISDTL